MQHVKAMTTTIEEEKSLKKHIFSSYISLRLGIGILALIFPPALYVDGKIHNIDLQGSMSAYYWVGADGVVPPRSVFVGCLLAIAAFLYLYKGFSIKENIALNLAAICGAMVAFFPMSWPPYDPSWNPHGASAIALFACLAFVALFCAHDTLPALNNEKLENIYKYVYRITGALMLLSPITAAVLRAVFHKTDSYIYFIELSGVLAFATYWIAKSIEMQQNRIVERVLGVIEI